MALDGTLTKIDSQDLDDAEQLVVDLQGPSSYANGGEAILPEFFPFRTGGLAVTLAEGHDYTAPLIGHVAYDPVNAVLRFFTAAWVEEANLADLSTNTYRLTVLGR